MSPAVRVILALPLFTALASAAPASCPKDYESLLSGLRSLYPYNRPWDALRLAETCSGLPGLDEARRAALLREEARIRLLVGDSTGAESAIERALKLRPGDPESLRALAEALRSRPEKALRAAEEAGEVRLAAEIRLDLGDAPGAKAGFEKALALDGGDLEALRSLARLDAAHAAGYARRACRTAAAAPLWARAAAFRACARIQSGLKDHAGAVLSLRRALVLDPDDADALDALVEIKQADPGVVISLTEPPPPEPEPLPGRSPEDELRLEAEREIAGGRLESARDAADRLTRRAPEAPAWERLAVYCESARLWLELKDPRRARAVADLVQRLDPKSLEVRRLEAAADPPPAAIPYFQENVAYGLMDVSLARQFLADRAGAEASLRRALELSPDDPPALERLFELKLSAGRLEEARAAAVRLLAAVDRESLSHLFELAPDFPHLAALTGEKIEEQTALALQNPEIAARLERQREGDRSRARSAMLRLMKAEGRPSNDGALQALSAASDAPWALDEEIRRKLDERRPGEALPLVERLIAATRDERALERAKAQRRKAEVRLALGEKAAAERSYLLSLEAAPGDPASLEGLLDLRLGEGRIDDARSIARRWLKTAPEEPLGDIADRTPRGAGLIGDDMHGSTKEEGLRLVLADPRNRAWLKRARENNLSRARQAALRVEAARRPWPELSAFPPSPGRSDDSALVIGLKSRGPGAERNAKDWGGFFAKGLRVAPSRLRVLDKAQGFRDEARRLAAKAEPTGTLWLVLIAGRDADAAPLPELLRILAAGKQKRTVALVDASFEDAGRAEPRTILLAAAGPGETPGVLPFSDPPRPGFSYVALGALRGWGANPDGTVTAWSLIDLAARKMGGPRPRLLAGSPTAILGRGTELEPGFDESAPAAAPGPQDQKDRPQRGSIH